MKWKQRRIKIKKGKDLKINKDKEPADHREGKTHIMNWKQFCGKGFFCRKCLILIDKIWVLEGQDTIKFKKKMFSN